MSESKITLGQAIDRIVEALQSIDEASRPTVLATVCAHLNIPTAVAATMKPSIPTTVSASVQPLPPPSAAQSGAVTVVDIRSLKTQKQPKSASQMACIVAYYLQEVAPEPERKTAISVADTEKYFKQAGFQLPKKLGQLLIDAKMSGYFESAGRGEYRLTPVGYNLVVHNLPATNSQ